MHRFYQIKYWSLKSAHPSRSLKFEPPIASKWSVSEKSNSSPVGSSSFCGAVSGTPSQSVLHAQGDSRTCSGGGIGVCFFLRCTDPCFHGNSPWGPDVPTRVWGCAFFFFFLVLVFFPSWVHLPQGGWPLIMMVMGQEGLCH